MIAALTDRHVRHVDITTSKGGSDA